MTSNDALCNALAKCIVERDFPGAHALLAPWYRSRLSVGDIERMVDEASEGLTHPPHGWSVDQAVVELGDLRGPDAYGPPSKGLSKEITDDNFRGWLSIQFVPDPAVQEEQNVCFDLWLATIEHRGDFQIGYLEAAEAT